MEILQLIGWYRRRKELQARIKLDATTLIVEYGDSAYHVARDRALETRLYKTIDAERTSEYWDRVRFEIRKRTGQQGLDTATKYLEDH